MQAFLRLCTRYLLSWDLEFLDFYIFKLLGYSVGCPFNLIYSDRLLRLFLRIFSFIRFDFIYQRAITLNERFKFAKHVKYVPFDAWLSLVMTASISQRLLRLLLLGHAWIKTKRNCVLRRRFLHLQLHLHHVFLLLLLSSFVRFERCFGLIGAFWDFFTDWCNHFLRLYQCCRYVRYYILAIFFWHFFLRLHKICFREWSCLYRLIVLSSIYNCWKRL